VLEIGTGWGGFALFAWDLYLGYCEAAFQDRHIGNVQLLFARQAASLRQAPYVGQPIGRSMAIRAK
jgi:hypothetical protein